MTETIKKGILRTRKVKKETDMTRRTSLLIMVTWSILRMTRNSGSLRRRKKVRNPRRKIRKRTAIAILMARRKKRSVKRKRLRRTEKRKIKNTTFLMERERRMTLERQR